MHRTPLINIRELDTIWQKQYSEMRYQKQDGEEGRDLNRVFNDSPDCEMQWRARLG